MRFNDQYSHHYFDTLNCATFANIHHNKPEGFQKPAISVISTVENARKTLVISYVLFSSSSAFIGSLMALLAAGILFSVEVQRSSKICCASSAATAHKRITVGGACSTTDRGKPTCWTIPSPLCVAPCITCSRNRTNNCAARDVITLVATRQATAAVTTAVTSMTREQLTSSSSPPSAVCLCCRLGLLKNSTRCAIGIIKGGVASQPSRDVRGWLAYYLSGL